MVTLDLSEDEYELIMKLRKFGSAKSSRKKFKFMSEELRKEFERQRRNMKKIASLKFNDNDINFSKSYSKSYRKVVKTETKDGKIYKVTYIDEGDGKGLLEKERKEIGKSNNVNYRFTLMSNSSKYNSSNMKSNSYSKIVKTVTEDGKIYKVTYEDKGDGKGMKKISKEYLGNVNNKKLLFDQFNTDFAENEFFKKFRKRNRNYRSKKRRNNRNNRNFRSKKNNRYRRNGSYSYQKKTILENKNGQGYLVTYENVDNQGFKEVKREKI